MTFVCGGEKVASRQITYSGDDSGVKLDISSGVGTAHARTAKEREKRKSRFSTLPVVHELLAHQ